MKKMLYFLAVAVLFTAVSCGTKPPAKPEEEISVVEDGTAVQTDNQSTETTETVQKSETTETVEKPETTKPVVKTDPAKNAAESAFKKAQASLTEAKKVGADRAYEEMFASAQADMNSAEAALNSGDYTKAKKDADTASIKLQTLVNLTKASGFKETIDENDFAGSAATEYSNAEIAYIKATEQYGTNNAAALTASKTALTNYETVLTAGYTQWIAIAKENAAKAKASCDSIKAQKAAASAYKAANDAYTKAKTYEQKKDYANAYTSYKTAAEQFSGIYDTVSVLRAEALAAMEKAKEQQQASSQLAAEADIIRPLTEADIDETGEQNIPEKTSTEPLPDIDNAPADDGLEN